LDYNLSFNWCNNAPTSLYIEGTSLITIILFYKYSKALFLSILYKDLKNPYLDDKLDEGVLFYEMDSE
jgi:hypothetical protein